MNIARRTQAAILALLLASASLAAQGRPGERWVGAWTAGVVPLPPAAASPPSGRGNLQRSRIPLSNQTLRQIVHTSFGGERLRVVVSNVFGTTPLTIGAAHVAIRGKNASIVPGSGRALRFSGRAEAIVPAYAALLSDPVDLPVAAFTDLAIDLYVPDDLAGSETPLTVHSFALQTSYISSAGNHAGAADLPGAAPTQSVYFLGRVEVLARGRASSSPSAIRLRTAAARRRTPIVGGPTCSRGASRNSPGAGSRCSTRGSRAIGS